MLSKPTCLHIPPLYEEAAARIIWESSDGADGYELDVHYDEDFKTASTGKTWSDIENAGLSAAEIQALDLTWEQIAKLPAQGLSWRNIEFRNPTWSAIDARNLSWQDIQKLSVEFIAYRGAGEKIQGPDQGLAWANIQSGGLSWAAMEALGWSWEAFMFRPSIGINWSQLQREGLDWSEIEAGSQTWHDFERQAVRGLGWGSLDARFLTWQEIYERALTWKQLESLPPDSKTHIAHIVDIPIYMKKAIFRVRAYKDEEYSQYLTSSLINTLPRSLAKYKPPCLHIPKLYEDGDVDIMWGGLYGAQGFRLERKLDNGEFVDVMKNVGQPATDPSNKKDCAILSKIKDVDTHYHVKDHIPLYKKSAVYRIKAYNTTDESQYLTSDVVPIIPLFHREDSITWAAVSGQTYYLQINAQGVRDLPKVTMNLAYPSNMLQLKDFAAHIPGTFVQAGTVPSGDLEILMHQNGKVQFRSTKIVPTGKQWNGLITVMEFSALQSGTVRITMD